MDLYDEYLLPEVISCFTFCSSGEEVICGVGNEIFVFNSQEKLLLLNRFEIDCSSITDIDSCPNSQLVAVVGKPLKGEKNTFLSEWDWLTGKFYREHVSLGTRGYNVRYSPDGNWLVVGGNEEKFIVISLEDYIVHYEFPGGEIDFGLEFHPDGKTIASATWSQADVRIQFCTIGLNIPIELPDWEEWQTQWWEDWYEEWESRFIFTDANAIAGLVFSPDGNCIAISHKHLLLYSVHDRTVIREFKSNHNLIDPHWREWSNPIISPDSKRILCGNRDGFIYIWDIETGAIIEKALAHEGPVITLVLSADGLVLLSSGEDKSLKKWAVS